MLLKTILTNVSPIIYYFTIIFGVDPSVVGFPEKRRARAHATSGAGAFVVRALRAVQGHGEKWRTVQDYQPRGMGLLRAPPFASATCDTSSTEGCLAADS